MKWNLRNRFLVPTVILFILCMGISSAASYMKSKKTLQDSIATQITRMAESAITLAEYSIENIKLNFVYRSEDAILATVVQDFMTSTVLDSANHLLARIKRDYGYYEEVMTANTQGIITAASDPGEIGNNIRDKEFFKYALSGKVFVSDVTKSRRTERPVIVISSPLKMNYEIVGVHFGIIDIGYFNEHFTDSMKFGKSGYAFMFRQDGLMIACPDKSQILKHNIKAEKFGQEMLEKGQGLITYTLGGIKKQAAYKKSEKLGWTVAVTADSAEVLAPVKHVGYINIIVAIACILMAIPVKIIFAEAVTRPIHRIIAMLGERPGTMDETRKGGNDEIKVLEATVYQMIEEIKQRKEALAESEKKYRELYQGSRDGYVMADMQGRLIESNSAYCEMLGYTPEELQNMTYQDITPEKWLDPEAELIHNQTFKKGYSDVYEKECIRKDGAVFPVELRTYAIRDSEGRPTGFWGFVRDITEKKMFQAESMRQARLASIGELAAGVAHEINNPLNGIINYAQILTDQGMDTEIPERIIKEGDRIETIVRNLLSFAREQEQDKDRVNIRNILSESMCLTRSLLRKDKIKIRMDVPDDLPKIRVNVQQIQQVFLNIISNARYALNRKFPDSGDGKILEIKTEIIRQENTLKLRTVFYDQGIGIPPGILDRICDPFFSTKQSDKGTGLGLSISHGIVEGHEGRLWFESVDGEYTKAFVELPVVLCPSESA